MNRRSPSRSTLASAPVVAILIPPMSAPLVKHSKFLSKVLRHRPEMIGLRLDAQGWADIAELLRLLHARAYPLTREQLEEIVRDNDKQRFKISADGLRIRASQGHSVAIDLGLADATPPDVLFHGTATHHVDAILREGLRPGTRQHVHLSRDATTAARVGARHGQPIVLRVASGAMHRAGHRFCCADNGVWLTDHVPPEFVQLEPPSG
jgi:putative RNA 2'-phosphotransferase